MVLVDDPEIFRLNEKYYGRAAVTDVLAFPYGGEFAELVLNPAQHARQAQEFGNSPAEEFLENILHGLLHLGGYDHTVEADRGRHLERQAELMQGLKVAEWAKKIELETK